MLTATGAVLGFFDSVLDEPRICTAARTAAEIPATVNVQNRSDPGLVARWGLNEGTNATTTHSVSSIVGTLTSGPSWIRSNNWFGTSTASDEESFCNGTAGGLRCAIHASDPCVAGTECDDSCNEAADNCADTAGTPCGGPTHTDSDDPDTCNGGASGLSNYEPPGTACGSGSDGVGDDPDPCDGGGTCEDNVEPATATSKSCATAPARARAPYPSPMKRCARTASDYTVSDE